jgi:hypothetical protein
MIETQGKTEKDNINQDQNQKQDQHQIQWIKTGALSVTPAKAPTTPALAKEPIRTELPAQHDLQQLPTIQNLLLHLERKGRSKRTITAYEKSLKAIAL